MRLRLPQPKTHVHLAVPSEPLVCSRLAAPSRRSFDDRFEGHGPGHVVEIGRGRHHRHVDLGEFQAARETRDMMNGPTISGLSHRNEGTCGSRV
jgi:hypothetical protein